MGPGPQDLALIVRRYSANRLKDWRKKFNQKNCPLLARNRTRAQRTAAKLKHIGYQTVAVSDDRLKSALGFVLFRLMLYSGALPKYQAVSLTEQGKPCHVCREGFTQYYR